MHYASAKDLNQLDKLAVQNGLSVRQMMELAGWHCLGVFERLGWTNDKKVLVMVGTGHKGGDGLTAARHLINYGYLVSIVLLDKNIKPDAAHHLELLKKMHVPVYFFSESHNILKEADIIVDALIGYNLQGEPRGYFAESIDQINKSGKPVLSYDLPSGFDVGTGQAAQRCVKATATLSLAWPKKGFQGDNSQYTGRIFLGDVGIPQFIYDQISPGSRPPFAGRGLVEL